MSPLENNPAAIVGDHEAVALTARLQFAVVAVRADVRGLLVTEMRERHQLRLDPRGSEPRGIGLPSHQPRWRFELLDGLEVLAVMAADALHGTGLEPLFDPLEVAADAVDVRRVSK